MTPRVSVVWPASRRLVSVWRLWPIRLPLLALAVFAGLAGFATAAAYDDLPGVADAPQRARLLLQPGSRLAEFSPRSPLARAVVGVEDERFFAHGAVDPWAIARVLVAVIDGGGDPGGSTLAQQLARVLYLGGRTDLQAKLKALALADRLENRFTKSRVLELYLNVVYLGHGAVGVAKAARVYFHCAPSQMDWPGATMLAGIIHAPSALDPIAHWSAARRRQREVVTQLAGDGVVTRATAARIDASSRTLRALRCR